MIRVLAVMEGTMVTGPAKNLFAFARLAANNSGPIIAGLSLATYQRGPNPTPFIQRAREEGLTVDLIPESRAFQPSILKSLAAIVRERKPDIIQTHNIKSHFLVRMLGLPRKLPWIAFHHGYVATSPRVHIYNQLDRWSLRAADRLVTVCKPFADQLTNIGIPAEKIMVRHNMIQTFVRPAEVEVDALRELWNIAPDTTVFLAAGRLSREKGHLDLIEAIGTFAKNAPSGKFRFIFAGDGPERPRIEKRSEELNISQYVQLVGHQSSLSTWYALANVMVLPSHSEGSPNVLLEAMAAGVPCIATSVGGVPEIATKESNALLVPREDPPALAAAMLRLMRDPALRAQLAQAGPAVTSHFTPDAYCQSLLALYQSVLAARAR